ncbi:MAG: sensor histidine kinase, partial [Pseudomonadota bacterium]
MRALVPLFVIVLLLLCGPLRAEVSYYPMPPTPEKEGLGAHVERYITPEAERQMPLAQVQQAGFERIPGFISRRYSPDVEWYRFGLEETVDGRERVLEFGSLYLNQIDVYLVSRQGGDEQIEHFRFGDHVPLAARPTTGQRFALPLRLEQDERVTVYARVASNSAMTFYASLWNRSDFDFHQARQTVAHGAYFGMVGLLLFIFLPLAVLFRRREFFAFSVLALALLLLNLGTYGYARLLFPQGPDWLPDAITGIGALGVVTGSGLIFITFLDLRRNAPPLFWIVAGVIACAVAGMPFVTTGIYRYFAENVLSFNALLNWPLVVFALFYAWRKRDLALKIYATSFVVTVVGGTVVMLAIGGIIPSSAWSLAAYQISTVIQMILLALGLGIEWWLSVRERSQLEQRALMAESRSTLLHNLTRFLSHELITPLAAAKRAIEMVEVKAEDLALHNRQRLKRAGKRLDEIDQMARFFLGRGGAQISADSTDAGHSSIEQVVEYGLQLAGDSDSVTVEYIGEVQRSMPAPAKLFAHALRNLVDNAMSHGADACHVTVEAKEMSLRVRVRDNGPGLKPEQIAAICDDAAPSNERTSGLRLVRFFMELLGGRLT